MKKSVAGTLLIILYTIFIPYLSRIWKGFAWVKQYFPEHKHSFLGFLFFSAAASVAAVPVIAAFLLRRYIPISFIISFILTTVILVYWHHDYDLSSDAQAALGLLVIPFISAFITGIILAISGAIEFFRGKKIINSNQNKN